ncbi:MAG: hypothetical protein JWN29_2283 [Acidimicrobiales bacterium]|nr:hypothetical protein [Acidimicrobiales bacterium]
MAPQPEWMGPPDGWLGGIVSTRVVLTRGPERLITLGPMTAYPTGVDLVLTHCSRSPIAGPLGDLHPGGSSARFGVAYADGSKWQSAGGHPLQQLDRAAPAGPLLLPRGGGGGGGRYRQELWLWPLPPPGPVTFAFAWPEEGVPESTVEVEGSLFQDAAARAEQLWEPLSPEEHQAIMQEHLRSGRFGPPPGTGYMTTTLSAHRPDDEND